MRLLLFAVPALVALACAPTDAAAGPPLIRGTVVAVAGAVSPDGRFAALGFDDTLNPIKPPLAAVYSLETGKKLFTCSGHERCIDSLLFTPDSQHLITSGWDHTFRVWSVKTGKLVREFGAVVESHGASMSVSADGKKLIVARQEERVKDRREYKFFLKVFDIQDGALLKSYSPGFLFPLSVAPSGDSRFALLRLQGTTEDDAVLKVFDLETGRVLCSLDQHKWFTGVGCLTPDAKFLIARRNEARGIGAPQSSLVVCEVASGKLVRSFDVHPSDGWNGSVRSTPDGKHLLVVNDDDRLALLELATGKMLWCNKDGWVAHALSYNYGWGPVFLASGKQFACIIPDRTTNIDRAEYEVRFYDLFTGKFARRVPLPCGFPRP
jgi:WD40 repeat protein